MSVAGLLDAMRADMAPAHRLVWMCLENHANGARWWSMTNQAIAEELALSIDTVGRAIASLISERIIRVVRYKRRPSVFYMLRTYGTAPAQPRAEDALAAADPEPIWQFTPQDAPSSSDLTPQDDDLTPEYGADLSAHDAGQTDDFTSHDAGPTPELIPQNPTPLTQQRLHQKQSPPEPPSIPPRGGRGGGGDDHRCERVVEAWNRMAAQAGLSRVRTLTPVRRRKLALRIGEHGIDGVLDAITRIGLSTFCRGGGPRGWKADFGFLLQPESLTRVLEDRYADRQRDSNAELMRIVGLAPDAFPDPVPVPLREPLLIEGDRR